MNNNKTGVFLTGGGGIGAFHIGFFKAMEEAGIKYDIVCGSSVGALVAGAATYLSYEKMFDAWKTLTLESVFKVDSNKVKNLQGFKRTLMLYKECAKSCAKRDPKLMIDINNIRKLLYASLDGEKIRESDIDFGVMTTELPTLKRRVFFKNEMKDNPLEYILASLYLPIFSSERILDNKRYVDISRFRKYPLDMLKDKGCKDIYIVNLETNNLKKFCKLASNTFKNGEKVTLIDYKNKPSILDFSIEQTNINYKNGYETTSKVLQKQFGL